jgi:hypothetical protein
VELKDARAVEPLIAALKDEDSGVRGRAALALDSIGGVKAQAALSGRAEYTYFALNVVNHPQFFSPGVVFSIEIEAKNVSDQTFATGDITVSFQGAVVCEVMTHNATAMKQLPKGSRIFSVEKQRSIRSEDLIVQALKEKWRPHEAVHVRLQLQFTTFDQSLAMLVRVAGKLTGRKELIFEPRSGAKDQQGLNSEHFPLMEDLD